MTDKQRNAEVSSRMRADEWVAFVGAIGVLGSIVILGWQVYHWLRFGFWEPVTNLDFLIWAGWYPGYAEWAGVQKMWVWFLDQSLSLTVLFGSIGLVWIGGLDD